MIMVWKTLNSEHVFKCPWITIRKDHVRLPSGIEIPDFFVSELPDWVNIIAITKDSKFIIEEQYRHGIQRLCYELCAGKVEPREDPLDAAQRELLEETGYAGGEWQEYGIYAPNASGCNNICYTFLATNVEKVSDQLLDSTEDINLHLLDEKQIKAMMLDGRIAEAVMLAPLWRYFANK